MEPDSRLDFSIEDLPGIGRRYEMTGTNGGHIIVSGGDLVSNRNGFRAVFDRKTGGLAELDGALAGGSRLNAFRAFTDNDKWTANAWFGNGLHTLSDKAVDVEIDRSSDHCVRIIARVKSQGQTSDRVPEMDSGFHQIVKGAPIAEDGFHFDRVFAWTVCPGGILSFDAT